MSNDLESGKKIVELFEKKIEAQNTIAVGFFGASIFILSNNFIDSNEPLELNYEGVLWLSLLAFGVVLVVGYVARMSLIACVPSMLNYAWGTDDASKANYNGKSVLEGLMVFQLIAFLLGIGLSAIFYAINTAKFVS